MEKPQKGPCSLNRGVGGKTAVIFKVLVCHRLGILRVLCKNLASDLRERTR